MELKPTTSVEDLKSVSDLESNRQKEDLPPLPQEPEDWYRVTLWKGDGYDPLGWPMKDKALLTVLALLGNFVALTGSTMLSPGGTQLQEEFHIGSVVANLGAVTLFVAGLATGPAFVGPVSEVVGRKIPLVVSEFLYMCFAFAAATAKDVQTLFLSRYFMGWAGGVTAAIVPATIGDVFEIKTRSQVLSFAIGLFMSGSMIGPIMGGYVANSYLGWRWTMYLQGILGGALTLAMVFFLRESFPPIIVRQKATALRKDTGLWPLYAPIEREQLDLKNLTKIYLTRPLTLLTTEPILLLISLYMGFTYLIDFLGLSAIPIIFGEVYGWRGGNRYLPYAGMIVGCYSMTLLNIYVFEPRFYRHLKKHNLKIWPEGHLPAMIVTSVTLPIGLFLLTWSGAYRVQFIVPTIGLFFIGVAITAVFIGGLSYIVETFLPVSASGVSASLLMRSSIASSAPLYSTIMFHNLGIQWAGTLLGCLAVLLAPIPICFYIFGSTIRSWSKNTVKDEDMALAFKDIHEAPELKNCD